MFGSKRFFEVAVCAVLLFACCGDLSFGNTLDLYLDGVNILGAQKSAYVQLDGVKRKVVVGDILAGYEVVAITPRAIQLKEGAGELVELSIHTRLSVPGKSTRSSEAEALSSQSNTSDLPVVIPPPRPKKIKDGEYKITPNFVKDEDIPEGYSRKRTPFGDFLIKNK